MKCLSILGSTGSIGRNALSIVARFPDIFSVKALAAGKNVELLADQIRRFGPELAVVRDESTAGDLKRRLPTGSAVTILHGPEGYCRAAAYDPVDVTLTAVVGAAGLQPTLAAIEAGKSIALANKETLVMAGEIVMSRARKKGVAILPVDSEHSAIFQCLQGQRRADVSQLLLTASGGPFRELPRKEFGGITRQQALKHPNWSMGPKITIDSATLMNKGLEVLEARWLFDFDHHHIRVVVHPQSIVHSMVAYRDGSIIAQLGIPDMKGAIVAEEAHAAAVRMGAQRRPLLVEAELHAAHRLHRGLVGLASAAQRPAVALAQAAAGQSCQAAPPCWARSAT